MGHVTLFIIIFIIITIDFFFSLAHTKFVAWNMEHIIESILIINSNSLNVQKTVISVNLQESGQKFRLYLWLRRANEASLRFHRFRFSTIKTNFDSSRTVKLWWLWRLSSTQTVNETHLSIQTSASAKIEYLSGRRAYKHENGLSFSSKSSFLDSAKTGPKKKRVRFKTVLENPGDSVGRDPKPKPVSGVEQKVEWKVKARTSITFYLTLNPWKLQF